MFFFQNLTAELFLLESPDDSYFPKSGGSTFLKTVGSHFSEICGNKITAYTLNSPYPRWVAKIRPSFTIKADMTLMVFIIPQGQVTGDIHMFHCRIREDV